MKSHWKSALIMLTGLWIRQCELSITGVTYMDHFDFEERYRNIHECDPIYWHPLHLPDYCIEIYRNLIRPNINSLHPLFPGIIDSASVDYSVYSDSHEDSLLSFHDQMMRSLKRDVRHNPGMPQVATIPGLGLVTLYEQPISTKSKNIIKKIASAYEMYTPSSENNDSDGHYIRYKYINPYKEACKNGSQIKKEKNTGLDEEKKKMLTRKMIRKIKKVMRKRHEASTKKRKIQHSIAVISE